MKLSVIIVSYNVKHYVYQCLTSLFRSNTEHEFEVFVVDNASTDGTVEYLTERFPTEDYPTLHIAGNKRNLGFGRANNQALAKARGEYVLFLNPDTFVGESTLQECLAHADSIGENLGVMGAYMLRDDGRFAFESRRGIPSPFTALCKITGLTSLFPKSTRLGRYYMRYLDENAPTEIEIVSGAFMLGRREALLSLGGFDKEYFMYGEDIDLSYRMLTSGRHNHYLPTPIMHYKGESTEKSSLKYVHRFYEAMYIFFNKHYSHYSLWLAIIIRIAIYARGVLALISQGVKRMQKYFDMNTMADQERYFAIVSPQNADKLRTLCEEWPLDATILTATAHTLPHGHNTPDIGVKPGDIVIYDTTAYTNDEILHIFRHGNHANGIGTYFPEEQLVVTHRNTFTP